MTNLISGKTPDQHATAMMQTFLISLIDEGVKLNQAIIEKQTNRFVDVFGDEKAIKGYSFTNVVKDLCRRNNVHYS